MIKKMFLAALLGVACTVASAADYPTRAVRIICTASAGSPLDTMARTAARMLGDVLKTNVIVENKTGGTGTVGMGVAMSLPADGYTLVTATGSTSFLMASNSSSFKPDDFLFFRGLQSEPSSMAVHADSPYRTMKDLIDAIRQPSSKISVGGFAAAGFHQFVFYRLQQAGGFESVWVPFQGGNQAVMALLGNHIDAAGITPSSALAQIERGEIRLLGISSATRDPNFPSVPTYKEQGYGVVEEIWRGLMVKKGTPPDVLKRLNEAFDQIEASADWQRFMEVNKQRPVGLDSSAMQRLVEEEVRSRNAFLERIGGPK